MSIPEESPAGWSHMGNSFEDEGVPIHIETTSSELRYTESGLPWCLSQRNRLQVGPKWVTVLKNRGSQYILDLQLLSFDIQSLGYPGVYPRGIACRLVPNGLQF